MQRFVICQTAQETQEAVDLFADGRVLLVGADLVLALAPERVHRIQTRCALRQPQQGHLHPFGQRPRSLCRVAGILVQQQRNVPSTVMIVDQIQERTEVFSSLFLSGQEKPIARPQVHHSEDHPAGVPAAQEHFGRLPARRPRCPKRWEQQQVCLILSQHNAPSRKCQDFPANPPFFFSRSGSGART
jgi:hypothetical protein